MFYAELIVFHSLNINFVSMTKKNPEILEYNNPFVLDYRLN